MSAAFDRFVDALCAEEGLVDIAASGTASQSSTSRWSQPDDPQRAVTGKGREFAFHTDVEDAPWWSLRFATARYPEFLVVENRRRVQFQEQAARLTVEARADGSDWRLLHAGDLAFGAGGGHGVPLVLPLGGTAPVREIRLSLPGRGPLHLARVRVLARDLAADNRTAPPVFLSNRSDGFGERLKSLVNAIALAGHFEGRFVLDWKPVTAATARNHSIGTAEDIFAPGFIAAHIRPPPEETVPLDAFFRREPDEATPPVVVSQNDPLAAYPALRPHLGEADFAAAFWRIGFSDRLQEAVDMAQAADIPAGSTALHLRAGDIVYGRYRFSSRYTDKVVPYPIARRFAEAERDRGRSLLIFGQDAALCRAIADVSGARFAGDVHERHGFDGYQAAIHDIVAMARCERIVAGSSGFSQIAAIVGCRTLTRPADIVPASEAVPLLRAAALGADGLEVSDHQRAFAAWYAYHVHGPDYPAEERIALLDAAIAHDPTNVFYGIVRAAEMFQAGQGRAAHAALEPYLAPDFPAEPFGALRYILRTPHPDGTSMLRHQRPVLARMAADAPGAARILDAALARGFGGAPAGPGLDEAEAATLQRLLG